MEEHVDAAELRALRERAYGPDADIHDDPEALARLEKLEAANAPVRAEREAAAPAEPAQHVDASTDLSEDAGRADDAAETPPGEALPGPASSAPPGVAVRLWRWMPALWVGSILVAVAVAVAATASSTFAIFAPIAHAPAQGRQLAVLMQQDDPVTVSFLGGTNARSYGDFHGITVLMPAAGSFGAEQGSSCLIVVPTSDVTSSSEAFSGPLYNGCSAGAFSATVNVPVTVHLPPSLTSVVPVGRGLQFVHDGDRVGVFVDR